MKKTVAEFRDLLSPHSTAAQIADMWTNLNNNRMKWLADKRELRNYVFATDTSTTTNAKLPWKNKTTLPKLCQIRDNLHANYMSALFPNDDWMKWEGHEASAVLEAKRQAIEAYLSNKTRLGGFMLEVNKLVYDYIDYGNVFFDVEWVDESHVDAEGNRIQGYRGPKLVRVSPEDHVFNLIASDYETTYKITRYLKTIGELAEELDSKPELGYNKDIVDKAKYLRESFSDFDSDTVNKAAGIQIDGFGSFADYLQSNFVELLEFEGSLHDIHTGELRKNRIVTIVDRCYIVRDEPMPSWWGKSTKGHCGWRERPDNLYAMGPLDNLIGMQYRIDHLENLKADAMDLAVLPPLVVTGNVEEFTYGPMEEIYVGEGGSITELGKNLSPMIGADNQIALLEQKMEEFAGAPKQAMGIRTPGEKTAFEVQTLEMAASRIFQNKITKFEIMVLEDALNKMLEVSRRHLDAADQIRVMDDDLGVANFMTITKEDITAAGKVRPIGARHFAAQATLVQNLMGLMSSPLGQDPGVRAHFSGKKIAKMLEEVLGLEKFTIYQENAQVMEAVDTQRMQRAGEDALAEEGLVDTEAPVVNPGEVPQQ